MKTYGLLGYPLGHSFSKEYFTEKFKRLGIEAEYLNFELDSVVAMHNILMQLPDLVGFNVTIPYKRAIIPMLDGISEEAERIGAVNCVKVERTGKGECDYSLHGYNTDVIGFEGSLRRFLSDATLEDSARDASSHESVSSLNSKSSLSSKESSISSNSSCSSLQALILGNGGASQAVRYVLDKMGIANITISRTPKAPTASPKTSHHTSSNQEKASPETASSKASNEVGNHAEFPMAGYPEVEGLLPSHKLIINTTPIGMYPKVEGCPDIPYEKLTPDHYLFDLIYNPETTEFMRRGAAQGAKVTNGIEMLHLQAEAGWDIWSGLKK